MMINSNNLITLINLTLEGIVKYEQLMVCLEQELKVK